MHKSDPNYRPNNTHQKTHHPYQRTAQPLGQLTQQQTDRLNQNEIRLSDDDDETLVAHKKSANRNEIVMSDEEERMTRGVANKNEINMTDSEHEEYGSHYNQSLRGKFYAIERDSSRDNEERKVNTNEIVISDSE